MSFPDKIDLNDVVWISCNQGWETVPAPDFISATKTVITSSEYEGIGGQLSRTVETTRGPALEVNNQYFADDYAYCQRTYGYGCNAGGSCKYKGLDEIIQGTVVTEYKYADETGELIERKVTQSNTRLSAAQPFDWRSSLENGLPTDFNLTYGTANFLAKMYRARVEFTEYYKENGVNVELTTTYVSPASRGIGINAGNISAGGPDGIKTTVKRFSTTTSARPARPDTTKQLSVDTISKETLIIVNRGGYQGPGVAGPYTIEKQVPVPLVLETEEEVEQAIEEYSQYIKKFVKGDMYGLQVAETLRSEICQGWAPGMAFRYADPGANKISAMRMDACTWGVTPEESVVVTNGIWTGFSSGTLDVGSNLVGHSTPELPPGAAGNYDLGDVLFNLGDGPTESSAPLVPLNGGVGGQSGGAPAAPAAPSPPPSVSNDRVLESYEFNITVEQSLQGYVVAPGEGVISPDLTEDQRTAEVEMCIINYCNGSIVGPGDLLEVSGLGTLPADSNGQLIVEGATVVDPDVFSAD